MLFFEDCCVLSSLISQHKTVKRVNTNKQECLKGKGECTGGKSDCDIRTSVQI